VGKKSVPPTLRKDHWLPFLHIHFPSPTQGMTAFRMLREFRKRHEFDYPLYTITVSKDNPYFAARMPYNPEDRGEWDKNMSIREGQLASRKDRMNILMDQKANSIADIAKVLEIQTKDLTAEEEAELEKKREMKMSMVSRKEAGRRVERFKKWKVEETRRIELLKTTLEPTRGKWGVFKSRRERVERYISERGKAISERADDYRVVMEQGLEAWEKQARERLEKYNEEWVPKSEEIEKRAEREKASREKAEAKLQDLTLKAEESKKVAEELTRKYSAIIAMEGEEGEAARKELEEAKEMSRVVVRVLHDAQKTEEGRNLKAAENRKADAAVWADHQSFMRHFRKRLKRANVFAARLEAPPHAAEDQIKTTEEQGEGGEGLSEAVEQPQMTAEERREAAQQLFEEEQQEIERIREFLGRRAENLLDEEREWRRKVLELESAIEVKEGGIRAAKAKLDEQTVVFNARRAAEKAAEKAANNISKDGEESVRAGEDAPQEVETKSSPNENGPGSLEDLSSSAEFDVEPSSLYEKLKSPPQIQLLWATLTDSSFAPSWPKATIHGHLPPFRHGFADLRFEDQLKNEGYVAGHKLGERKEKRLREEGYDVGDVEIDEMERGDKTKAYVGGETYVDGKEDSSKRGLWQGVKERVGKWNKGD
jgi:hypothetical protein